MPVLPLPLVFTLFLCVMFAQSVFRGEGAGWLRTLLLICAVQNGLLALVHYYGFVDFRFVLPITATVIPAFVWVSFQSTAVRVFSKKDVLHLLAPASVAMAAVVHPNLIDALVPLIFAAYGVALLLSLREGEDRLHRVGLQHGSTPLIIWRGIGAILIVSAVSDVAIAADHIFNNANLTPWIITFVGALSVLALGALAMAKPIAVVQETQEVFIAPEEQLEDAVLMSRLNALVTESDLFLNPDLTLSMLSRKLAVPAKRLSSAINRETGQNVSRYINAFRIEHAAKLLKAGHNVTQAMFDSGFNTKSNFNREFLRVKNCTPRDWRAANQL